MVNQAVATEFTESSKSIRPVKTKLTHKKLQSNSEPPAYYNSGWKRNSCIKN